LAAKIDAQFAASTRLIEGGGGVFDVHVNGVLVYSKHQTGEFPDEDSLVSQIAENHC